MALKYELSAETLNMGCLPSEPKIGGRLQSFMYCILLWIHLETKLCQQRIQPDTSSIGSILFHRRNRSSDINGQGVSDLKPGILS